MFSLPNTVSENEQLDIKFNQRGNTGTNRNNKLPTNLIHENKLALPNYLAILIKLTLRLN